MCKKFKILFLCLLPAILIVSCRKDGVSSDVFAEDEAPASLSFTIDVPFGIALTPDAGETKAADGDLTGLEYPDNPDGMSDYAKYVDGRAFAHLMVLLVNYKENKIVAYRDLYKGSPDLGAHNGFLDENGNIDHSLSGSSRARVTFDYDNPKHVAPDGESAERFHRGTYWLMAVANMNIHSDVYPEYQNLVDMMAKIRDDFNADPGNGLGNFAQDYSSFYQFLLKLPLDENGNQPYVRPKVPQFMTLTQEVILSPGMNMVEAKLVRPTVRFRLEMKNYSESELTVHDFSLSDNFTQTCCYLFGRTDGSNYDVASEWYGKGSPDVTSDNAIVSFTPGTTIATGEQKVLFDGYLYESKDDVNDYVYSLDLGYEGVQGYFRYDLANGGQPITTTAAMANYEYYLIKRSGRNDFLYDSDDGKVHATYTDDMTPEKIISNSEWRYCWNIVRSGRSYGFYNPSSDNYIASQTSQTELGTTANSNSMAAFTVSASGGTFAFMCGRYYMDVYSPSYTNVGLYGTTADVDNRRFELYPLEYIDEPRMKKDVPLYVIDNVTAEPQQIHELKRNDFVRVLVEVHYNPDIADFEFEVVPWTETDYEIEFN